MDKKLIKELSADTDGLLTYEYIANNPDSSAEDMDFLIKNIEQADSTGQFLVSAARYLHAIDSQRFEKYISHLVATAITRDRERRYIGSLLEGLYGADYADHIEELSANDDNFRRIYKRMYPLGI